MLLYYLCAVSLLLDGCARDITLTEPGGTAAGRALLVFDSENAGRVTATIEGREYSGEFSVRKVDESAELAVRYGLSSRRYQEYALGRGNPLRQGRAELRSPQGDSLLCGFSYRGTRGRGQCATDNGILEFLAEG